MQIKSCLLLLLTVWFTIVAEAQYNKKNSSVELHSINAVGLLNGSAGASVSLQTIFGISMHQSFAGIGAGLDYYRMRSVPLFVDVRHEFGKTNRVIFVYADAGYHFDWLTDKNKLQYQKTFTSNNFTGSMYYDAGVGYKIKIRRDALLLSGGYTFKEFKNKTGNGCPTAGPCSTAFETYTYSLPRIILKIAYQL